MADAKLTLLPSKLANLNATDLLEVTTDDGGSPATRSITGEQLLSGIANNLPLIEVGSIKYSVRDLSTEDYILLDGSILLQATHPQLYSKVGLIDGVGVDESTEFKLPNYLDDDEFDALVKPWIKADPSA